MIMNTNPSMIAHWRARQSAAVLDNQVGTVLSWTKVYVAPDPFESQVPYCLAIIALDGGQHILCPIVDVEEDELSIGARVQFVTRIIKCPDDNAVIFYGTKAVIIKNNIF